MKKIIEKAMAKGASSCELFFMNCLQTRVSFEANKLKGVSRTEERGAALRVVKDGRIGFATTTKLSDTDRLVDDALATAPYGDVAAFDFARAGTVPAVTTFDQKVADLDVESMMARSRDGIARLLDHEKRLNIESSTDRQVQEIRVLTSRGLDVSFARTLYEFGIGARLIEGTSMLDCSGYYGGTSIDTDGPRLIDRVIDDVRNGRTNADVSTGPTTVLLTPKAMADIMMTLHAGVSAAMVDRKISPLTGRLGETILDERVSISDDGLASTGFASAPCDDEGVPMERTPVIVHGMLKQFLTDLRTSRALGLPPTGNGLRAKRIVLSKDLGKAPAPEITNWEMSGGDTPRDALVDGMKSGIIVDAIMGILMGNLLAGDFSGNISLGFKVENGAIRGRVKDTMIAGNVYRLFKENVLDISSEVERVGMLGGVGSHRYPHVLLRDVPVSTKA